MNKNNAKLALPLFIVWPFGAFILSLFDIKSKSSAIVWILFSTLFGYAFVFQDISADSYRVAMVFDNFRFYGLDEIYHTFRAGGFTDLYRHLMYGITKSFTNNPKVLFAFFGFVFGVFSYLSVKLIVKEKGDKHGIYWFIIILLFISTNPFPNINGARFWTATWLFFYATANLLLYNKKRWILGVLSAALIHFSFLFIIIPVLSFYFFPKVFYTNSKVRSWLFLVFFITFFASFVLETNAINIGFLKESSLVSSSVSNKVDLYGSDKVTEAVNERSASLFHTVSRYFGYIKKVYFLIFLLLARKIIAIIKYPKQHLNKLFAFILFYLSVSFIASSIPSGSRFVSIGYLFALILLAKLFYIIQLKKLKKIILWSLPVFSFTFLFVSGYLSFVLVSPTLWYGNIFWILLEGIGFEFIHRL